jgi:predicted nucleic acid-binding protein
VIVIDTSVWADHFHRELQELSSLIDREEVLQHPYVTDELALGNPRDRKAMVAMLEALDQATVCLRSDFLLFIDEHKLGGTGIGFVDAHLLVSTAKSTGAALWTRDKRLLRQAERLGVAFVPRV